MLLKIVYIKIQHVYIYNRIYVKCVYVLTILYTIIYNKEQKC